MATLPWPVREPDHGLAASLLAIVACVLALLADPVLALPCANPVPVKIHAEVIGYEAHPGTTPVITGLGTASVGYGQPLNATTPSSPIDFKPTWWQSCDPDFLFAPFRAWTFETDHGATHSLPMDNGQSGPSRPKSLHVQVTATTCGERVDFSLGSNPLCNAPCDTAGGGFWMSIHVTANDSRNVFWSADGCGSPAVDPLCAFTFEGQRAAFGLAGCFGSFHPTSFVPLDTQGLATRGDDPHGPVILALPEPGTLLVAALAMAGSRSR